MVCHPRPLQRLFFGRNLRHAHAQVLESFDLVQGCPLEGLVRIVQPRRGRFNCSSVTKRMNWLLSSLSQSGKSLDCLPSGAILGASRVGDLAGAMCDANKTGGLRLRGTKILSGEFRGRPETRIAKGVAGFLLSVVVRLHPLSSGTFGGTFWGICEFRARLAPRYPQCH